MKRIVATLLIFIIVAQTEGQTLGSPAGSWLNENIYKFYEPNTDAKCDSTLLEERKITPLYLSFRANAGLEIVYRFEQRRGIFPSWKRKRDSIIIPNASNYVMRLEDNGSIIEMNFHGRMIRFRKVSETFSHDVFFEYISHAMFSSSSLLTVTSCQSNDSLVGKKVRRSQLLNVLRLAFHSPYVEGIESGFTYNGQCLPAFGVWNRNKRIPFPHTFGVFVNNGVVQLLDEEKTVVLRMMQK